MSFLVAMAVFCVLMGTLPVWADWFYTPEPE